VRLSADLSRAVIVGVSHSAKETPANSAPPVRCWLSAAQRDAWRTIVSAAGVNQGSEADDGIVAGVYGGMEKIAARTGFPAPIGEARFM
jgi:hypothetical protein